MTEAERVPVRTAEVLAALRELGKNIPQVSWAILNGMLTAERQHQFGDLVIEAGRLIKAHVGTAQAFVVDPVVDPEG